METHAAKTADPLAPPLLSLTQLCDRLEGDRVICDQTSQLSVVRRANVRSIFLKAMNDGSPRREIRERFDPHFRVGPKQKKRSNGSRSSVSVFLAKRKNQGRKVKEVRSAKWPQGPRFRYFFKASNFFRNSATSGACSLFLFPAAFF